MELIINFRVCRHPRVLFTDYSRYTIMSTKSVGLTKILIYEHTLSGIMVRMPVADCKQWAKERTTWMQGDVSLALKDSLFRIGEIRSTLQ